MFQKETEIEQNLIKKLEDLKYTYRPDIRDKATLKQNFRDKFEALNHVRLTDAELRDFMSNYRFNPELFPAMDEAHA